MAALAYQSVPKSLLESDLLTCLSKHYGELSCFFYLSIGMNNIWIIMICRYLSCNEVALRRKFIDIPRRRPGRNIFAQSDSLIKYHQFSVFEAGMKSHSSRCSMNSDIGFFLKANFKKEMKSLIPQFPQQRSRSVYIHQSLRQPPKVWDIVDQLRLENIWVFDPTAH